MAIQYLDVDMAMPIGLIINEWVTNSFKYAFPAEPSPVLTIDLSLNTDILTLRMQDNGPRLDPEKWEKSASFGHKLIIALTRQLHGKYHLGHQYGARIELTFPIKHPDTSS